MLSPTKSNAKAHGLTFHHFAHPVLVGSDTFGRVHSGIPTQRPGPRAIHVVTSSPTSNPQTSNGEHVKGIESTAHVMALTD